MAKLPLFKDLEDDEPWREEWNGMPEFIMEDLKPFKEIIVRFRNQNDMDEFLKLLNQKVFNQNGVYSLWFPKMEIRKYANKRYVDEP